MPGRVQGPLIGGNLEVFSRLVGTPYLPDPTGAVLFLEDIGERPYRVDRLLTHLDLAGLFNVVAAVIVGDFVDCKEAPTSRLASPPVEAVLEERLGRLAICRADRQNATKVGTPGLSQFRFSSDVDIEPPDGVRVRKTHTGRLLHG